MKSGLYDLFPPSTLFSTDAITPSQVITRPIIPDPDGVMADIYVCLFEAGFHIIGKNHRFDLMLAQILSSPSLQPTDHNP